MSFQAGDQVEWDSQSRGYSKVKQGKVVAVLPAESHPIRDEYRDLRAASKTPSAFGKARSEESYLVLVPSKTGKGKPTLYWPRTAHLRKVEQEGGACTE